MSELTGKAVFLSYAREDTAAAKHIAEALRAFGIEVWFDQSELRGGDAWDQKIRGQIKTCTLFLPIVSGRTEERSEGYFRREWRLAIDRTQDMAANMAFIVPVVIDDTAESGAAVPEEFLRYQWTRLAHGEATPEFVTQVKRLLESPRKMAGRDRPVPLAGSASPMAPGETAGQKKSSAPVWTWGAMTAVAVGVVTAIMVGRHETPPAPPPIATEPKVAAIAPAPAPIANDKSIAVLPFTNMSEEKDSGFFSDGIHEDILTNLALVKQLRVVSRTSVMQYRDTTKTIRQIAQELNVAYILEGSVRRSGNKVRVTGQLIHAATDEHVWAQNFDRDLTDVFSIQSELSRAIADAMSAVLSPQEKSLLARRPTENLAAYDAYVKARQMRDVATLNNQDVEPILLKAVELDPKFAAAWAELGSYHAQTYFNDIDRSPERLAKARAAIETAVQLAPDAPEVIEKYGDYFYYGYRDFARASEQYLRLAVLRPNDAAVFGSLGFIHRRQGRWEEALKELRRAYALEPRNLRYARTLEQLAMGLNRYEEASVVQQRIMADYPDLLFEALTLKTIPFAATGSTREGQEWIDQLKPEVKASPLGIFMRKAWARGMGDWETAIRLDGEQRYYDVFGESHWSQDTSAAGVFLLQGDVAKARTLAEKALVEGKIEVEQKPSATAWGTLAQLYVVTGNKSEALRCAQKAKDLVPESADAVAGPPVSVNYAQVLAWTGEKDQAIAELTRLLRTPFGENIYNAIKGAGWFPLRDDPRFVALVNDPKNNAPLP